MIFNEDELLTSICREDFYSFFCEFWGTVVHGPMTKAWHLKYLCNELQIVGERVFRDEPKLYDLVINVPPGSTKSTICSQMFPAWVWTRMPYAQFICISYAERIALKDALRMRDIVESTKYQRLFKIELRVDLNTKGLFKNTQKGQRLSSGLGGQVMGEHAHFLIVDDPLDPEQSYSDVELKSANRFMETTLPSRKINKDVTPTILVQQRLHQSDPSGEMLERARGKGVKHICLPGRLTEDLSPPDLAANYVDGLLDPIRLSDKILSQAEQDLGAYGYASQILQSPVPLGGGLFQTDKFVIEQDQPKRFMRLVRSWDKAGTDGGGAYSVGVLMGVDFDNGFWILDIVRGRWGAAKREAIIRTTAEMDGYEVEIVLEIEGGSGGKESGENTTAMLAGYKVFAYHPTGDKEARAYPLASQVGAGKVKILNRPWLREFIQEIRFFPNSKYKDQVDAVSAAFNRLARKRRKIGAMFSSKEPTHQVYGGCTRT